MKKFRISIDYEKIIEASSSEEAENIIQSIEHKSNLDDGYGPFSSLDVFTSVEELVDE